MWNEKYSKHLTRANGDISQLKGSGLMPFLRLKKFYEERVMTENKDLMGRYEIMEASALKKIKLRDAPVANWTSLGPNKMVVFGGRMTSHAFDPVDKDVVYAGSATGGLWKTTNGGLSWRSMTDDLPSVGVGGIAVNPKNRNQVVIGTGEGYFLGITVRPGIGIFISENGGETWAPTSFQFPWSQGVSVLKMAWDPDNTNNVYAAATNGVWLSRDGGYTWQISMAGVLADDVVIDPTSSNILYCAIENDGIYKSEDYGRNWQRLGNGLPQVGVINFARLAICHAHPNTLYTSLTDAATLGLHGLYRTDDGGETWYRLDKAPNAFCPPPPFNYGCQGFYDNAVAVSPMDPDLVILGGITLWRSGNGGESWTQHDVYTFSSINPPPGKTFVDHHDLGFSPHDEKLVYSFSDGGVAISTNTGGYWTNSNEGILNAQFYALASSYTHPKVLIGGMQDHGLQATDLSRFDDQHWIKWGGLDGSEVIVDHKNPDIFYGVWIDGQYLKTYNGTGSYQTFMINSGIDASENITGYFNPLAMDPINSRKLITATPKRIYMTTNGTHWVPKASIPDVKQIAFDQVNPDYVYATSYHLNNGTWGFWRSQDGGESWRATASPPGWRTTDLLAHPSKEGVVYATRNSGFPNNPHVYLSEDYGDNWTSLQGDLPDITVNSFAVNPFDDQTLYVGTDLGIYISINGGENWTTYNEGMPVAICYDIHYHPMDTTLRVGTIGRSAWMTYAPPGILSSTKDEQTSNSVQIYPSPSQGPVHVELKGLEEGTYNLSVFSERGRVLGKMSAEHSEGLRIRNLEGAINQQLQPGIYYLVITQNQKRWVESFVKL